MRESEKYCNFYRQIWVGVYFLVTSSFSCLLAGEIGRAPANFVPDDDAIVVPMVVEKNFIDEFHDKHKRELSSARRTLTFWLQQEQYAQDYGLEDTGIVILPTEEQKQQFLQRNYLRFISKDVERSTNSGIQNAWERWTTDDEIDAITAVELHEKVIVKAKKNRGRTDFKSSKTVKVGKDNFRFGFQPRLEIGMVKFTMKSKYFHARAWVGINGNQEIKLERRFKSTNTKAFVNYYIEQTRYLAALDQKLTDHWLIRATHVRDFEEFSRMEETTQSENNTLQLRFNMRF